MRKTANDYVTEGEVSLLVISKDGKVALMSPFDTCHLPLVKQYHWNFTKAGYVVSYPKWKGSAVWMHRVITDASRGLEVDHINHRRADNRGSNLRVVTKALNQHNRKVAKNIKFSVLKDGRTVYRVFFRIDGVFRYYGNYDWIEDAEKRRDEVKASIFSGAVCAHETVGGKYGFRKTGTSGQKYVCFHKATGKWSVSLPGVTTRTRHVGLFDTIAEAVVARDKELSRATA